MIQVENVCLVPVKIEKDGLDHIFIFKASNKSKVDIKLVISKANGYAQQSSVAIVHAEVSDCLIKLPVRLFGNAWSKESMELVIEEFVMDFAYDYQEATEKYYANYDPDSPLPSEEVYKKVSSKTFSIKLPDYIRE